MNLGSVKTTRGGWLLEASTLQGQIIIIGSHLHRSHSFFKVFYTESEATRYIANLTISEV